jgi:hypothetical protein
MLSFANKVFCPAYLDYVGKRGQAAPQAPLVRAKSPNEFSFYSIGSDDSLLRFSGRGALVLRHNGNLLDSLEGVRRLLNAYSKAILAFCSDS